MDTICQQGYLPCVNYQGGERPLIEYIELDEMQVWIEPVIVHKIVFITEGSLECSFGRYDKMTICTGNAFIIPVGYKVVLRSPGGTSMIIFRLNQDVRLCDSFPISRLSGTSDKGLFENSNRMNTLAMKSCIWEFFQVLDRIIIERGFSCYQYFRLKISEFFFLLIEYYTREELYLFFKPLIFNDSKFADVILTNMNKVKSVKDLAMLTNYSVSGFEKHFKRIFGVSAGKWLKENRAMNIYHEINSGQKSFKLISSEFSFSSVTYFNDYCKTTFGVTPGVMRKQNNETINHKDESGD